MDSSRAGYGNTTSAIDAIQFKISSGNIDSVSVIKMCMEYHNGVN